MATTDKFEQNMLDMFINTCQYLTFLTEKIISSNINISPDVLIVANNLNSTLSNCINNVCKNATEVALSKRNQFDHTSNHFVSINSVHSKSGISSREQLHTSSASCDSKYSSPNSILNNKDMNENAVSTASSGVAKHIGVEPIRTGTQASINDISSSSEIQKNVGSNVLINEKINCDISTIFQDYIQRIHAGCFKNDSIGIFCGVCDLVCMKPWLEHISYKDHINKTLGLKKLKMFSCRICRICIYGSKQVVYSHKCDVLKYFEFHFNILHSHRSDFSWKECLIETQCAESFINSSKTSSVCKVEDSPETSKTEKKKRNRKKTKQTIENSSSANMNLSNLSDSNSLPVVKSAATESPSRTNLLNSNHSSITSDLSSKTILSAFETLSAIADKSKHHTAKDNSQSNKSDLGVPSKLLDAKTPPKVKKSVSVPSKSTHNENYSASVYSEVESDTQPVSPYSEFDRVIDKMKTTYTTLCIKCEMGYCIICQKGFENFFDWFNHLSSHESEKDCKEEICIKCNIKLFGIDHEKYLSLPGHKMLDKMMSS